MTKIYLYQTAKSSLGFTFVNNRFAELCSQPYKQTVSEATKYLYIFQFEIQYSLCYSDHLLKVIRNVLDNFYSAQTFSDTIFACFFLNAVKQEQVCTAMQFTEEGPSPLQFTY